MGLHDGVAHASAFCRRIAARQRRPTMRSRRRASRNRAVPIATPEDGLRDAARASAFPVHGLRALRSGGPCVPAGRSAAIEGLDNPRVLRRWRRAARRKSRQGWRCRPSNSRRCGDVPQHDCADQGVAKHHPGDCEER